MADVDRLLQLLRKQAGKTIKVKALAQELEGKGGRRSRKHAGQSLQANLDLLCELRLIEIQGSSIQIKMPFSVHGRISFNQRGLAFVAVGADRDIFIAPEFTGAALPGDLVEVRLINRSRERFEGRVLKILSRERELFRMKVTALGNSGKIKGMLLDVRPPLMALLSGKKPQDPGKDLKKGSILLVRADGRRMRQDFTDYLLVEACGRADEVSDQERIIMKYGYSAEYPAVARGNLPQTVERNQIKDLKQRKDVTGDLTITIDGADAKDFDDALSLKKSSSGWTLGVHIADVSYYVEPESELDLEARKRATSVYLPGRVLPMLPPELSEELCSLKAGVLRLAFSVSIDINRKGEITGFKPYRSIIQVDHRLTYDSAEDMLLRPGKDDLSVMLGELRAMADALRKNRQAAGRIDLDIPEVHFKSGTAPERRKRQTSSIIIEEAMLSANTCVALALRKAKRPALFRVHAPPEAEKLDLLNYFLELHGIDEHLQADKPRVLQDTIARVKEQGEKPGHVFQFLLLRSFMQAVYAPDPDGHWALAMSDYCHFTSPIRRYPDLICHRALGALLSGKKKPFAFAMVDLARHCSDRERRAMEAERDAIKLAGLRYLDSLPAQKMTGMVSGFKYDRVFLELENGLEAIVLAEHLGGGELMGPDPFSVYVPVLSRPVFLGEEWQLELYLIDFEAMQALFKPEFKRSAG